MHHNFWPRAILLVDMNAFFASVEQADHPELQNKPVAITNGPKGRCIVTSSYEARKYGIKTGMDVVMAQKICPHLIIRPARHNRYVAVSAEIMSTLKQFTPDCEVFSIDEAFLDVTYCQKLWGQPKCIAKMIKKTIADRFNMGVSIGVSGDKTTAKFAASLFKPNGIGVVPPWEAAQRLQEVPVSQLCGIGPGVARFLAVHGVHVCGDMKNIPVSLLIKRFGHVGQRIWHMCQGSDPSVVQSISKRPKSMEHSKVLPHTAHRSPEIILAYFYFLSFKLAMRMRQHGLRSRCFWITYNHNVLGWLSEQRVLSVTTDDGQAIYKLCKMMIEHNWHDGVIRGVCLRASNLEPKQQANLFTDDGSRIEQWHTLIDVIHHRYGEGKLMPARWLSPIHKAVRPNVPMPPPFPPEHPKF